MNRSTSRGATRRLIAAAGAAALAMVGVFAASVPASAAVGNMPTDPGTLTIHKYEQPAASEGLNNDGSTITIPGSWVALDGVQFRVQQITDVNLNTNAGWDLATTYAGAPSSATQLAAGTTVTTAGGGIAALPNLPVGAYLVTELPSPDAKLPNGNAANITMTAAPFVVTLPIPTDDGTWNSNVHVYPKNSLTAVTKTPSTPQGNGIGSVMTWTIDVKIPFLTAGQSFTDFDVTDALDAKLAYVAGSAKANIAGTPVTLTDNTSGQNVSVSPTDLSVLAANQGKTLTVTFDTTVVAAGEIVNKAAVFVNDPNHGNAIASNPATTYWGQINILKHAEGDVSKTLAGAVFTVHATEAQAAAGTDAITVGGATEFTTGADGTVVIQGLFVSNTAGATNTYYLREITAPAGYNVNPTPTPVTLTANGTVATPVEVKVPDPQKPQLSLPLTGGDGTRTLMIAGGGLLVVAIGVALFAMRRRAARN